MTSIEEYKAYKVKNEFLGGLLEFECIIKDDKVLLNKYNGKNSIIVIPSFISGVYNNSNPFKSIRGTLIIKGGLNLRYLDGMFKNSDIEELFLDIDCHNIESMEYMCENCKCLKNVKFGNNLYISSLLSVKDLFHNCINLKFVDFGNNFDTSFVIDFSCMFNSCNSLEELNLNINTKRGVFFNNMFSRCYNLRKIYFGDDFRLIKAKDTSGMFSNCEYLESVNIEFSSKCIGDISSMFYNCRRLRKVVLGFDLSNCIDMFSLFEGCSSIETIIFTNNMNIHSNAVLDYMFIGCKELKYLIVENNLLSLNTEIFDNDINCNIHTNIISQGLLKRYRGISLS